MSWNNYNIGIPNKLVPLGELVILTTGTTLPTPGTHSPGRIYENYRCTHLIPNGDNRKLTTTQLDAYGANIEITSAGVGEIIAWNFTGRDVINWNEIGGAAGTQDWTAMCYCQDPCRFPSDRTMSGQTFNYAKGYGTDLTNIGGTAWNDVTPGSGTI